jgi:DNA repair exonuclease SbcCD ATPase subunit
MSTRLGKILVCVNLFASIALASWAVALYTARPNFFDNATADPKIEGQFTKYKKELDELNSTLTLAQSNYSQAAAYSTSYEQTRDFRNNMLGKRLALVRKGDDANITFKDQIKLNDKQFSALIDEKREGNVIKGVRDTPLQGLGYLTSEMRKSVLEETSTRKAIEEARRKLEELSARVQNRQDETFAQKVIRKNLVDQKFDLGDVQTNWDEQLKLLERRKVQLSSRLAALGINLQVGQGN